MSLSIADVQRLWNRFISFFLSYFVMIPSYYPYRKYQTVTFVASHGGYIPVPLQRKLQLSLLICCSYEEHLTAVGGSLPVSSGAFQFPALYFSCV